MKQIKALGCLSGGLDSILAVKLLLNQGIKVHAINFSSPLCLCNRKGRCEAVEWAQKFKIPIKVMAKKEDYFKIIKNPKHGYGKNMNPCIDCRIYMFKKTKEYAKKIKADFIFTGEVLDERPMSQHFKALKLIEKEAKLKNKILRPLSAKLLPETEAEKKGYVNREKLFAIKGRSRKRQIELAKNLNLVDYHCPSGGCLLTNKGFALKVKDLVKYNKRLKMNDILLLKIGRHFRIDEKTKVVVGRNKKENKQIKLLKQKSDIILEPKDIPGPTTLLRGYKKYLKLAASLTAKYSDSDKKIKIKTGRKILDINPISDKNLEKYKINK